MPLGDSITYDNNMGDNRPIGERIAYRLTLHDLLISEGYAFDFVGSENGGDNYLSAEMDDNAGFPGITDSQLAVLIETGYSPRSNSQITPGPYLDTYPADVILLHIGTNGLDTDPNDVKDILDHIRTSDPNVIIFVARIIDFYPHNETVTIFNDNVEAMVAARADSRITMVDMEDGAGIDYAIDMADRLHPNKAGYDKMAKLWFEHLMIIFEPYKAYLTYPTNGSYQWPPEFKGLQWSIPEPRNPGDVVTCDVYIGTDPNELELIAAYEPNNFLPSDAYPIIADHNYFWRVDCNDPNAGNPVVTEGRVWNFHTFDPVPHVYAGEDMSEFLPARGSKVRTLQMDATVNDQGDPNSVLYYLWSVESAPADAPEVVFNDNTVEDPLVTFFAAGEYVLRLSASDDGPVESQEPEDIGSDMVAITIKP
jgi:lysophospholipase L1-like esterase